MSTYDGAIRERSFTVDYSTIILFIILIIFIISITIQGQALKAELLDVEELMAHYSGLIQGADVAQEWSLQLLAAALEPGRHWSTLMLKHVKIEFKEIGLQQFSRKSPVELLGRRVCVFLPFCFLLF